MEILIVQYCTKRGIHRRYSTYLDYKVQERKRGSLAPAAMSSSEDSKDFPSPRCSDNPSLLYGVPFEFQNTPPSSPSGTLRSRSSRYGNMVITPPSSPTSISVSSISPRTNDKVNMPTLEYDSRPSVDSLDGCVVDKLPLQYAISSIPKASLHLSAAVGRGQWSTVYQALTDPVSDVTASLRHIRRSPSGLYAIKIAGHKSAQKVIRDEATMLTALSSFPDAEEYIVPFYGYHVDLQGLVLGYLPVTLQSFALIDSASTQSHLKRIAQDLVQGLAFLHSHSVIHADIKPCNILLHPQTFDNHPKAVLADFSASFVEGQRPPESAGTYDFMAPELFCWREPACNASMASDVYALGVTLVAAVIGHSPFQDAGNAFALRAMAKRGDVFAAVQSDFEAWRKVEDSGCGEWVEGALRKEPESRWTALQWTDVFKTLF